MKRAFLKMARAQAATTAYREALDLVRRHQPKEAERLLLQKIAAKRVTLDDWRRLKQQARDQVAHAEYLEANRALLEE